MNENMSYMYYPVNISAIASSSLWLVGVASLPGPAHVTSLHTALLSFCDRVPFQGK